MAVAMIGPKFYAWNRDGKPLAFGKLYTYQARTNTPKPTYQSEDQIVENTNPVILNGEGYANVYLSGSYKMVLKDENENEIWSSDPVSENIATEWVHCLEASYVSPLSFKVKGNQTDSYESGRKVRLNSNSSSFAYSLIVSSSYSSGETLVTISDAVVTTGIETSCVSIVGVNSVPGNPNLTFGTVEEMKLSSVPASGALVTTKGYYEIGDKGAASYIISGPSTPDEIADHTLSNGLTATLQIYPDANIFQFGAKDDDEYDNVLHVSSIESHSLVNIDLMGGVFTSSYPQPLNKNYINGKLFSLNGFSFKEHQRETVSNDRWSLKKVGTKTFLTDWRGKNVLWLGTSIPHQGAGVDGYPELFGDRLGCNVDNFAWSSSHATYDIDGDAFSIGTVQSLSMTESDRLAGLSKYGTSSAYDDSFDLITLASEMTCDFRIKNNFDNKPYSAVMLDHNHNDLDKDVGTINPPSYTMTSISIGAQTIIGLTETEGIEIGNSVTIGCNGIVGLEFMAARVSSVGAASITIDLNTSGYAGSFVSGILYLVDKNTLYGSFDFLITYINYCANSNGYGLPQISLCSAPSEYTFDNFSNGISSNAKYLSEFARARGLPFFNVMESLDIDESSHIELLEDGVHPITLSARKAFAAHWVDWATGGAVPTLGENQAILRGTGNLLDQRYIINSKFIGGSGTPNYSVPDPVTVLSEDFTNYPAGNSWTPFGNAPTVVAAPWNAGELALKCSPTLVQPISFTEAAITSDESAYLEFDLWLDSVANLTPTDTQKTMDIATLKNANGAYQIVDLLITKESVKVRFITVSDPGVSLSIANSLVEFELKASTKYRIRLDSLRQSSSHVGALVGSIDGTVVAANYKVYDVAQTDSISVWLGSLTNNTGKDQDFYIGNAVVGKSEVFDLLTTFNGSFSTGAGQTVNVTNGIITSVV